MAIPSEFTTMRGLRGTLAGGAAPMLDGWRG
jgi:hypothetical protein